MWCFSTAGQEYPASLSVLEGATRLMRLFVALHLPPALREALSLLRGSMPGVEWVPAPNYHISLRFIGEITDRHVMQEIDLALGRLSWKPLEATLAGALLKEGSTMDSLALGVERSSELDTLQSQIESLLRRAGLSPAKRRFQPHVTLGHLRTTERPAAIRWVQSHNLFRGKPMQIEHVTLFESLRGYEEQIYVPRAEYAWNPALQLSVEDE